MSDETIPGSPSEKRRIAGGILVLIGLGWLVYMVVSFVNIAREWGTNSSDISLTFALPLAVLTGPIAVLLIVVGVVVAFARIQTTPKPHLGGTQQHGARDGGV